MFEDSTFESTGRIHTRSRRWMVAALLFNGSILLAMVLIPLIYPEALPRQFVSFLMIAPAPQPAPLQQQPPEAAHPFHGAPEIQDGHVYAPSRIPRTIAQLDGPEQAPPGDFRGLYDSPGVPGADGMPFRSQAQPRIVVHPDRQAPVRVTGSVEAGLLLRKTIPRYPVIAVAAHQEGTVVLEATISRNGVIENLHVISGPIMLQQAALDAVETWVYKPYLLSGQPVDVETTINVVFRLGQ